MSSDTKPITRHFFGLEVRVDRAQGGRQHSRECPSVPEAIDAGYLYACHNRPLELRIREPERGQTEIGNPGQHRLEWRGRSIYQSPRRPEVEEAELVFRRLQEQLWARQSAEHFRQRELLPGLKVDLEAQIAELDRRAKEIKEEATAIREKLTALDPYKATVTDDTIAELGAVMARRVAGDRLTGELADGTTFDEETGEVEEERSVRDVAEEAARKIASQVSPDATVSVTASGVKVSVPAEALNGPRRAPKRGGR
jgi:hypothetical protein